jgi:ribosomal protein S18 acetylase RimI-like enzyme
MTMTATRTYLEMTDQAALRPARVRVAQLAIARVERPTAALWRFLYTEVGRQHRWFDRLPWTDEQAQAYLDDPAISLWIASVDGETAGYFELHREDEGAVEIVYFGLLPQYTGRGLGGALLTEAVERAWASGAARVWLHTCTFDHPAAIPNYLARGFAVFKTEEYTVPSEGRSPLG